MYLMSGHLKHFVESKTRTVKRRGSGPVRKKPGPITQVVDELVLGHANARVLHVEKGESRKSTSRDSLTQPQVDFTQVYPGTMCRETT